MSLETEILADGPEGYWRLNHVSDGVAVPAGTNPADYAGYHDVLDSSGNGRDGVYRTSAAFDANSGTRPQPPLVDGDGDGAQLLNSANVYIEVPQAASETEFTIEFLVRAQDTNQSLWTLQAVRGNNAPDYDSMAWNITATGSINDQGAGANLSIVQAHAYGETYNGSNLQRDFATGSVPGVSGLLHIVYAFDDTGSALYINNTKYVADNANRTSDYNGDTTVPLRFFTSGNVIMDEIVHYSTKLSDARVGAHYNAIPLVATSSATAARPVSANTLTADSIITHAGTINRVTASNTVRSLRKITIGTAFETDFAQTPALTKLIGTSTTVETANAMTIRQTTTVVAFEGYGDLQLLEEAIITPTMVLQILDKVVSQAPTPITVVLVDGARDTAVDFFIDGVLVWTSLTNTDGDLGPVSINVPESLGAAGQHTLTATQFGSEFGSDTFTILYNPSPFPADRGPDAQAVEVPGAVTANGTRRWVLQDLLPEASGGIGSYIMPLNPKEMTPPYLEKQLHGRHSTAIEGQWHIFEAAMHPKEWQFSGYCPTQEMYEKMEEYRNLNRRFYIIDHRNRAWKVVIVDIDWTAKLHENYNGVDTNWAHNYQVNALILDQYPVVPA